MSCNEPRWPGRRHGADLPRLLLNDWISMNFIETHESAFACIDEGLCREPFPHERACGAVVHRVKEAADVIIDLIIMRSVRYCKIVVCSLTFEF